MLIWENIKLALGGLLCNKMRSLLTMLGIIIGIGSVIAIMTVSTSLTSSITDTFAELGAGNITVGLKKQSEGEEVRSNGMRFGTSNRQISLEEEDRITDEMIEALKGQFSTKIDSIALEESAGSGIVRSGEDTANVQVSGINAGFFKARDITLLAGRRLTGADLDGARSVIMVSDKTAQNIFGGDLKEALNQEINIDINDIYYSFYIVGIYQYEGEESFTAESEEDVVTSAYIPITTGKRRLHTDDGYEQFTIVTDPSVESVADFADEAERYMNRSFYAGNEDYQIKYNYNEYHDGFHERDDRDGIHCDSHHCRNLSSRRRHRGDEHHACLDHRTDQGDWHTEGPGSQKQFHPSAVYCGICCTMPDGGDPGNPAGNCPGSRGGFLSRLFCGGASNGCYSRCPVFHGDRYLFWLLSRK